MEIIGKFHLNHIILKCFDFQQITKKDIDTEWSDNLKLKDIFVYQTQQKFQSIDLLTLFIGAKLGQLAGTNMFSYFSHHHQ